MTSACPSRFPGAVAKKRLEELKQHQEQRREESMRSRQIVQRLGVEEAHMVDFQQFNAAWDDKMKEYEERATELLEAMRQRHMLDYNDYRKRSESEPQRKPKFSKELLDLRKIEVTLAKQCEYAEAQKVKVHADEMEAQVRGGRGHSIPWMPYEPASNHVFTPPCAGAGEAACAWPAAPGQLGGQVPSQARPGAQRAAAEDTGRRGGAAQGAAAGP